MINQVKNNKAASTESLLHRLLPRLAFLFLKNNRITLRLNSLFGREANFLPDECLLEFAVAPR